MSIRRLWGSGRMLWLRRHHVPVVCCALVLAEILILKMPAFSFSFSPSDDLLPGGDSRKRIAVSGSIVAALLLAITLAPEDPIERVCARSEQGRRVQLILIVLGLGILAATPTLWNPPTGFGALVVIRNLLGLIGLILIGYAWLPNSIFWLPVTANVVLTALVGSWWKPTTLETIWGFLHQPGGFRANGGAFDASWVAALLLFGVGCFGYLGGSNLLIKLPSVKLFALPKLVRKSSAWLGLRSQMRFTGAVVIYLGLAGKMLFDLAIQWGGDLSLLFTAAISTSSVIMIPASAVLGAWVGQARSRSGIAFFDRVSRRSLAESWFAVAKHAGAIVFLSEVIALSVLTLVTLIVNRVEGVPFATTLGQVNFSSLWAVAFVVFFTLIAMLFSVVGFFLANLWTIPAVVVAAYLVMIPIANFSLFPPIPQPIEVDKYSQCAGENPRVCSLPSDAAYLKPAHNTLATMYSDSGSGDVLPQTIFLYKDLFFPHNGSAVGNIDSNNIGVLPLENNRGIVPPQKFEHLETFGNFLQSFFLGCKMTSSQRWLLRIPEKSISQESKDWYRQYFTAARNCNPEVLSQLEHNKPAYK